VEAYSITDAGVGYIGLEVDGLDSFVAWLKDSGISIVSDGIVSMAGGYRVALVRDPDVGAFVELYEPPKR